MSLRAAVVGATGLIGKELVTQLAGHDEYVSIVEFVRRPIDAASSKVTTRVIDFDTLPNLTLDLGVDHAFCCLGTTLRQAGSRAAFRRVDHDYVVAFAKWIKSVGCRRLLAVSAVGADPNSRVFYNRVKGEVESALGDLGFDTLIIVRPSLLTGERDAVRAGERIADVALRPLAPFMLGPLRRYRPIAAKTVARAMLHLALDAQTTGMRRVESEELAELGG